MQKIANPQQNQGVQRFFCFVTVKDGILLCFKKRCNQKQLNEKKCQKRIRHIRIFFRSTDNSLSYSTLFSDNLLSR